MLVSDIEYIIEDFLEDENKTISYKELNELQRLRENPEILAKSKLFDKIKYYVLPFLRY